MRSKAIFLVAFVQAALLVIFYLPWLLERQTFYFEDCTNFFEPLCSYIGISLQAGHWPLWNPFNYCGMPQIAISSPSLFYPFNLLFACFSFSSALAQIMIASQLICGLGGFLLVSELGWGMLPALLCSTVFAFSGYMFSTASNYTLVATACWFPLSLWSTVKIKGSQQSGYFGCLLAFCLCMMITAGRFEISVLALLSISALVVYLYKENGGDGLARWQKLSVQIKSMLIGILLAMPVLLPSLEWLPLSRRSAGLNHVETLQFSANWYDLISLFCSQPLGDLQESHCLFRSLIQPHDIPPYFNSAFVGPVPMLLCIAGIMLPGGRFKLLALLAFLLSIVVSLGANFPFLDVIVDQFPVLSIFRFPSKLLFFTDLFIGLFAARALYRLRRNELRLFYPLLFAAVVAAAGLSLMAIGVPVLPFIGRDARDPLLLLQAQQSIGQGLLISALVALFVGGALSLGQRKHPKVAAGFAVAATGISLVIHAYMWDHRGGPDSYYQGSSALARELEAAGDRERLPAFDRRFIGLYLQRFSVPRTVSERNPAEITANSYQYSRQILRPFANIDYKISSAYGFEGAMVGEYYLLLLNSYFGSAQAVLTDSSAVAASDLPLYRLLQLTATHFAVTQCERFLLGGNGVDRQLAEVPLLDDRYFRILKEDKAMNFRLYQVRRSLPRAYLSFNWLTLRDRDAVLGQIYEQNSNYDPRKLTLLEPPEQSDKPNSQNKPDLPLIPLSIKSDYPERLEISCQSGSPSLLVLSDQYYPGWIARVDGQTQPLVRCDGFMRAVFLNAGAHKVVFEYSPASLTYGYILFGLALLWAAAMLVRPAPQGH